MLTQARLHELFQYSPETGVFTRLVAPGKRSDWIGATAGSYQNQGYLLICVDYKKYKAHRLAWLYMYGEFPQGLIDHINGIKDDNRISNLRVVNKSQNEQNKPTRSVNTSGVTGVYFNRGASKWQAHLKLQGKVKYLGIYRDWFDAVCARKVAESMYFGEFAHGAGV